MGYVVIAFANGDDNGRRFGDALSALEAWVGVIRRDDWPLVRDDAGRRVNLAHLLEAATAETTRTQTRRRMIGTLADFVELGREDAWKRANERWKLRGTADSLRRPNAEELERLGAILFGEGAWREAGRNWAWQFELTVPSRVIDELAARFGGRFSASEVRAGVREGLEGLAAHRRRALRADYIGPGPGSPRPLPGSPHARGPRI